MDIVGEDKKVVEMDGGDGNVNVLNVTVLNVLNVPEQYI